MGEGAAEDGAKDHVCVSGPVYKRPMGTVLANSPKMASESVIRTFNTRKKTSVHYVLNHNVRTTVTLNKLLSATFTTTRLIRAAWVEHC